MPHWNTATVRPVRSGIELNHIFLTKVEPLLAIRCNTEVPKESERDKRAMFSRLSLVFAICASLFSSQYRIMLKGREEWYLIWFNLHFF